VSCRHRRSSIDVEPSRYSLRVMPQGPTLAPLQTRGLLVGHRYIDVTHTEATQAEHLYGKAQTYRILGIIAQTFQALKSAWRVYSGDGEGDVKQSGGLHGLPGRPDRSRELPGLLWNCRLT
jgi:hypothetical protein